ncbi:alpha/beta hydrolase [Providencia alcalifaciens]|uniref:alpha/beta hydrolase n=1 Tax=Providencia alcalifaciens TaxID=126385 RepID=UPI001CE0A01D|nr:alpha/beta hydrolase [Providencia alcalifaciens]UBX49773.1 alpha/beta hydrolase [Providencia alcalifaciens]
MRVILDDWNTPNHKWIERLNDIHLGTEKAHQLADIWGSQLILVKGGEHLNTDAGYGEWREGERLIEEFTGRRFVGR